MSDQSKRIAINVGGDYVPGLNAVIAGVVLAADQLGWQVVGIRDGFDGLLFPDRYADGGVLPITPRSIADLPSSGALIGNATRTNPFRVRTINAQNMVEEIDRSDDVIAAVRDHQIAAVISIVDSRALSLLFKLSRKGLVSVCVPKSVENDVAATALSFGFNSALNYVVETLDRVQQAAQATGKIGVVEVLGEHAGWLALQAGMAVQADAVLIPEIPYDLGKVAARLATKFAAGQTHGLVIVAQGAAPLASNDTSTPHPLQASLSPLATGQVGDHVINRSGHAAQSVALGLQRLTDRSTYPLVLNELVRSGAPTATDRQLGLGYGAGAVRALHENCSGVMVVFQPPDLKFVPLAEAINQVRPVPADSLFVQIARTLGISLGDEVTP